jgi:hypothetical protein
MYYRVPIALLALYLLVAGIAAENPWPYSVSGLLAIAVVVLPIALAMLFRMRYFVDIANRPVYRYMGTNNSLWLWILAFTLCTVFLWLRTQPAEFVPANPQPVQVAEFEPDYSLTPEQQAQLNAATDSDRAALERKFEAEAEALAQAKNLVGQKYSSISAEEQQRYENYVAGRGMATDLELEQKEFEAKLMWLDRDNRRRAALALLALLVLYLIPAIWDEARDAFERKTADWSKKTEGISKPVFHDAARKILSSAAPVLAGTAAVAGGQAFSRKGAFWVEVAGEALGNWIGRLFHFGRR